jgi:hypothetical protein
MLFTLGISHPAAGEKALSSVVVTRLEPGRQSYGADESCEQFVYIYFMALMKAVNSLYVYIYLMALMKAVNSLYIYILWR